MITIKHIESEEELKQAFSIREKVYIEEQQIDREDEFDQFEDESQHFLAQEGGRPCGAARYRKTSEGIKLERFAVLPEFRRRGIASLLIESMLEFARAHNEGDLKFYLNAQLSAMPLYAKFGFESEGEQFLECDIEHQKMVRYM